MSRSGCSLRTKWIGTILAATALDVAARFALGFDMSRILVVETLLFLVVGLVLLWFLQTDPPQHGWRRWLQVWTIAGCFLAGLRVGLWAAGVPVAHANIVIIVVPVVVLIARAIVRKAARTPGDPSS